jgi:hypothetical protein
MRSVALESKFESWGDPSLFGPKIKEINHPLDFKSMSPWWWYHCVWLCCIGLRFQWGFFVTLYEGRVLMSVNDLQLNCTMRWMAISGQQFVNTAIPNKYYHHVFHLIYTIVQNRILTFSLILDFSFHSSRAVVENCTVLLNSNLVQLPHTLLRGRLEVPGWLCTPGLKILASSCSNSNFCWEFVLLLNMGNLERPWSALRRSWSSLKDQACAR